MDFSFGWVKNIYERYADPIVSKMADYAKDEWEKFKIDTDIAFRKYLENSYEKYSKIKTILYRTEPKFIYNFFEYPNLIKKRDEIINSKDIDDVLDISHYLIIQGNGGIGKSTFMKHLFINEVSKKQLIPIFIELKDLNDGTFEYEICDFIYKKLYNFGCDFNEKYLEYALQSGCFLFLLDGYDEILSEKRDIFFKKITDFSDRYTNNYYIISSRPYSEFVEFQKFSILTICPFEKEQAISLIKKIDYDYNVKQGFIKALEDSLYEKHTSFASNPLLLNIMLLTYDNYAEIPDKLHLFYSNAFETLYYKHDATKGGYKREMKSKLSFDEFKKVFSCYCFITYYQGKMEFSYEELLTTLKKMKVSNVCFDPVHIIYDLVNSICVLYKDGLNYKFTHRSFQEYFAAVFLKELSDDNMKRMGLQLIRKDPDRASHDSTINMLYDMCGERVEQNIILPILSEIEQESIDNKYDFYYRKCNIVFCFDFFCEEEGVVMAMTAIRATSPFDFIRNFSRHYKCTLSLQEMRKNEEDLLEYLQKNTNYEMPNDLEANNYKIGDPIYEMIKSTWIGQRIQILADLSDSLRKKKIESELDLNGLLF